MLIEKGWLDICCLYIDNQMYDSEILFEWYDNKFFFENQKILIVWFIMYFCITDKMINLLVWWNRKELD